MRLRLRLARTLFDVSHKLVLAPKDGPSNMSNVSVIVIIVIPADIWQMILRAMQEINCAIIVSKWDIFRGCVILEIQSLLPVRSSMLKLPLLLPIPPVVMDYQRILQIPMLFTCNL